MVENTLLTPLTNTFVLIIYTGKLTHHGEYYPGLIKLNGFL